MDTRVCHPGGLALPSHQRIRTFSWTPEHQKAFEEIKRALLTALALALPDLTKPFTLYVDERAGVAQGVLAQALRPWKRPVAYLSKKLLPAGEMAQWL